MGRVWVHMLWHTHGRLRTAVRIHTWKSTDAFGGQSPPATAGVLENQPRSSDLLASVIYLLEKRDYFKMLKVILRVFHDISKCWKCARWQRGTQLYACLCNCVESDIIKKECQDTSNTFRALVTQSGLLFFSSVFLIIFKWSIVMIFYTTRRQFHINREKGGEVGREKVTLSEGLCVPVSTQQRATAGGCHTWRSSQRLEVLCR